VFGQSDSNFPQTSSPSSSSNIIDLYREYYLNQSSDEPSGSIKVTFDGTPMLLFDDVERQLLVDVFITYPSGVALLDGMGFVEFEGS
jgi:hypothetical protein